MNKLTGDELDTRYKLGTLVLNESKHATYGSKAVAAFAQELNLESNTLLAHAAVARVWSKQEFKDLSTRRGGEGDSYRLSWSHFVLLAGVKDGRTRNGLISAAFAETLSEKALRARRGGASQPGKSRLSVGTADAATDVADAARELEVAGQRLSTVLDDYVVEDADRSQLLAAQETLERLEHLLAEARNQIAQALAKNDDAEAPKVEQEPAPVQFSPPEVVQEPAPFNPRPVSISRAVAESVQVPSGTQEQAPFFVPSVSTR
ncbi:MAG: hypothetical protein INH41_13985 [Myxococcaceae bacterium]|nr:hypothetical protein [Myxococcaceae bacterium]MCA3013488.1 hypothetical protein [Myxococcaceae bacterium]